MTAVSSAGDPQGAKREKNRPRPLDEQTFVSYKGRPVEVASAMQFDILDPHLYAADPFPVYRWLRAHAPVYWDAKNEIWIVSKYREVEYVSRNPQLFCSGHGVTPDADLQISIVSMDDPRHAQLRALVSRGFTPRMIKNLTTRIREIVTASIDAIAGAGGCDFVADLAVPLPLLVIAEMIGIREEDRARFHEWSDTMILAAGQQNNPAVLNRATQAYGEFAAYLQDIFADRKQHPREDLVSILVAAQVDGTLAADSENISADELLMFMTLLLVAGNETTRNAMSGGLLTLIEYPEERAKLLANPGLINTATEEILRWVAPIVGFRRTATQDTELGGQPIRAGQKVLMLYQSANRDPDAFEEPDRFKIDRHPNYHLAFGVGPHFCLGANLARMEIRVMFEELFRRLPDITLAPGATPVRVPSPLVRGIASLPCVFTPEAHAARAPGRVAATAAASEA
jgi:cytochrome P450 family 142 subfamily A polypeptide 1